jgi:glycine/serine hydroxymethyltransferase
MTQVTEQRIDIKAKRDELVSKKALNSRNRENAERAIKNMRDLLSTVKEEDLQLLSDKGINARNLMMVDLDRIYVDQSYYEGFLKDLGEFLQSLETFILTEGA